MADDSILKTDSTYKYNDGSSLGGGTFSPAGSGDSEADQDLRKGDISPEQ